MFWSLFSFIGTSLYILLLIIPTILISWVDHSAKKPHIIARYWARWTLFCANVKVRVEGGENIPASPAVYMSNHVSHFDVFAILGFLMVQFRWAVKRELFRIPLFGLAMKKCGYIMIDRANHEKAVESMQLAAGKIREGTSVLIFPEGTRSVDGQLKTPLKKGGFHLAIKAGVPIVPITVRGSYEILAKNSNKVCPGTISIRIGSPIEIAGHDIKTLMDATVLAIQKGFED
jgi:1-acyl-sn-glycerol-3-phosphate acyltransferase